MKQMKILVGILCVIALSTSLRAGPGADAITIDGSVAKPGDWTIDRIRTEFADQITSLDYVGHDGPHTSKVVPLISLLKAAGVETQLKTAKVAPNVKHAELHYAVVVQGRDGYYTVLSIAELMPEMSKNKFYLALDVDGKPWPATEAPMKMIASDDGKPARWVHSVQTISVVKLEPVAAATQPVK
jgi:DMSO/TMAO reductase YedYZ molybdopterin-dependent catalytic subunit